jgi:hypothetical protein
MSQRSCWQRRKAHNDHRLKPQSSQRSSRNRWVDKGRRRMARRAWVAIDRAIRSRSVSTSSREARPTPSASRTTGGASGSVLMPASSQKLARQAFLLYLRDALTMLRAREGFIHETHFPTPQFRIDVSRRGHVCSRWVRQLLRSCAVGRADASALRRRRRRTTLRPRRPKALAVHERRPDIADGPGTHGTATWRVRRQQATRRTTAPGRSGTGSPTRSRPRGRGRSPASR